MELNPLHPVTKEAHDNWHKIAALIMIHFGKTELKLTLDDAKKLFHGNLNIVLDGRREFCGDGLLVRLVDNKTADALVRKEGGSICSN
jgi:hypothetical protein